MFRYDLRQADGILIRLARRDEYAAVGALLLASYGRDYDLPAAYRAELADTASRAEAYETWVAVDRADGRLLGTVTTGRARQQITPIGRSGEVDFRLLGVDPGARRRGIGRVLTEHVITLARLRGAPRVVMNSGGQMHTAHRLYETLGFRVLTERVRVFDDGHVSLAYGLDLDGVPG